MRRLGKLAPKIDSRTLLMSDYIHANLPPAPLSCDYSTKVTAWGMMKNDELGDCTIAAAGHLSMEWNANANRAVDFTDAQIVGSYSAVTGYDPTTGLNDDGAVELDVLKYWRRTGIAGHKIIAFGKVNKEIASDVKQALYLLEGLYIGVSLPNIAQNQEVWDLCPSANPEDAVPGSWGGHAVCAVGYDENHVYVVTWGEVKKMTWDFWNAYVDEAYGIVSMDMLLDSGKCPTGFDLKTLMQDLHYVSQVIRGDVPPLFAVKKKAVIVGGNWMLPDDGDTYWNMKEQLLQLGYDEVVCIAWNKLLPSDLTDTCLVIVYSYGCAALWAAIKKLKDAHVPVPTIFQLVIIAGVPDAPDFGQFYGSLWHAPENFQNAVAINITAIPASCSLQNSGTISADIADFNGSVPVPMKPYFNINADSAVDWFQRHEKVKGSAVVQAVVDRFATRTLQFS